VFSSDQALPDTVYRARETVGEKQVFDPAHHEIVFELTEKVFESGVASWTLTQPASDVLADPIVTQTLSDLNDASDWTAIFRTTNGDQFQEREIRDDGFIEARSFVAVEGVDYVLQSSTTEDAANLKNWQSITYWFDEERQEDAILTVYDSGLERTAYQNGGVRTEVFLSDAADTKSWQTQTHTYEEGVRTEQVLAYDNGTQTVLSYGLDASGDTYIQSNLRTDQSEGGDAFSWQSIETRFEASGDKTNTTIEYNDGRVLEDSFESGLLVERVVTDQGDQYSWRDQTNTYEQGLLAKRQLTYDNGSQTRLSYGTDSSGESYLQLSVRADQADAFVWREIETRFDEQGERTETIALYDDGRVRQDDFELGVLSARVYTDPDNQYSWYQINEVWEDGVRVSRDVFEDAII